MSRSAAAQESDMPLKLYTYFRSSAAYRVRLALNYKGLAYDSASVHLRREEHRSDAYRELNPQALVPALETDGVVIPQSLAIIEYLEETFPPPDHPALWPAEVGRRSRARWLAAEMHAGFTELRSEMAFHLCFQPRPPKISPAALGEAAGMLALWEESLTRSAGEGPFLLGAFSAADIMYAPAVVRLQAFGVPLAGTPRAATYIADVLAHPAVRRWMEAARALPPVEAY